MKLSIIAAALIAAALPAAPALAHKADGCRDASHHHKIVRKRVVHRVAYRAPVRHKLVRTAACGCRRPIVHQAAYYEEEAYPVFRPRTRVVEIDYIRERPYRPRRYFHSARIERPYRFRHGRRFHEDYGFRERRFHHRDGYAFRDRGFRHERGGEFAMRDWRD